VGARIRAAYYGLVGEVDHHLGRTLDTLRASGAYDRTLIVVTSDHGEALGDHWMYGRRGPFDGHFRVPCLIRDPRASADAARGTQVDALTAGVDLLPTICAALGVDTPATAEGASLEPWLHGTGPTGWREHVRYDMSWDDHLHTAQRADLLRTAEHRVVSFPTLPPMLFDLAGDPGETTNRATDPALATVLSDLTALI